MNALRGSMTFSLAMCVATVAASAQAVTLAPLADFVGTYQEAPGHTLELVAGDALYAVIDEAKYPLRRIGSDVFLNGSGDTITFPRTPVGVVTAYVERGVTHPRLSPTVTAASQALATARPAGAAAAAAYRYQPPTDRQDGIPVGDLTATDLDVATAERVVRSVLDGTYKDVHGILLFQRGKLVLEEYFYGYSADRTHQMRSMTKSVVGALAGIAIDRGAIASADVPVTSLLRYASLANPDPRKNTITLADFLSMRSGLACNDYDQSSPGRETVVYDRPDWAKATLDLPMLTDRGTSAYYCSGGVMVVARAVATAVRMPLPAFADTNLFSKLGIASTRWRWNPALDSTNREYGQINLTPRDMLKFGMLFANGGTWHGTRVISESWVRASLAAQSVVDGTDYGYLWWRPYLNVETKAGVQRVTFSVAQGNGGQKVYLIPELDLIAVFTGGDYNSGGSPPNRIMTRLILPALLEARKH